MKSILYLMHIPWGWIKQRPHFFAEELAQYCIIDVYYRRANTVSNRSLLTQKDSIPNLSIKGYNEIPFSKIPIIKYLNLDWLNTLIVKLQLSNIKQYDFVWLSSPIQYHNFKPLLGKQKLIYDCMDDMIEFPNIKTNKKLVSKMLKYEKELLIHADYIVVSSEYLKNKILKRANIERNNVIVINNAVQITEIGREDTLPEEIKGKKNYIKSLTNPFMYVGMISPWFDFNIIDKALEKYPNLNIILIGPCEIDLPKHSRIHYLGLVERKYIFPLMQEAYALIMPFKLNELIYSVNPVKLYEYIYMEKPVVSIRYGETEKFEDFVCLYKDTNEWLDLVGEILQNPQEYTKETKAIHQFIKSNTWNARVKQIVKKIQL